MELTEIGRNLLDITFRMTSLEVEAAQVLSAARALKRGHLRIGADAPYHSIPFLNLFHRRYPQLRLSMAMGNSQSLLHDLLDQRCDIAIAANIEADQRIHSFAFRQDHLIAFVERGHPWSMRRRINVTELAGQRLVLREPASTTRQTFDRAIEATSVEIGEILEIGSREAIREAVAAGLGIGIVAASELGPDLRLRALELEGARMVSTEYVACLQERRATPMIRAFLEVVREGLDAPEATR